MDAQHIENYLARNPSRTLNTDDNAYLEYRTPFEFIEKTESIVSALTPYAGRDLRALFANLDEQSRVQSEAYFDERLEVLVSELSTPIQ